MSNEDRLLTAAEMAEVVRTTGLQQSVFNQISLAQDAKTAAAMQADIDQANEFYEGSAEEARVAIYERDTLRGKGQALIAAGKMLANAMASGTNSIVMDAWAEALAEWNA